MGTPLEYRDDRWSEALVSRECAPILFWEFFTSFTTALPQAHVAKQFRGLSRGMVCIIFALHVSAFPHQGLSASLSLPPLPNPAPKTCYQETAGPHSQ